MSFHRETRGGVAKCQLFSQAGDEFVVDSFLFSEGGIFFSL